MKVISQKCFDYPEGGLPKKIYKGETVELPKVVAESLIAFGYCLPFEERKTKPLQVELKTKDDEIKGNKRARSRAHNSRRGKKSS